MKIEYLEPDVNIITLEMKESTLQNLSIQNLDGDWVDED